MTVSETPTTVLDLGCGDGRLLALVRAVRPSVRYALGVDSSQPMLTAAATRFDDDPAIELRSGDLREPIEPLA